jgi:hypothetical protein
MGTAVGADGAAVQGGGADLGHVAAQGALVHLELRGYVLLCAGRQLVLGPCYGDLGETLGAAPAVLGPGTRAAVIT